MANKKGPGRPKGSKNKRRRRNRQHVSASSLANGAPASEMGNDPVLTGFQAKRTQYTADLTTLQTKLANLDASEKAYIEGNGGNVGTMGIPADLLLTTKGTIDMRSDRGREFIAAHPEYKGKVVQH